jgi:hypothetical protein
MKVIEFPKQTGARLTARPCWRVQPPPIRIRPNKRETLAEFLDIVCDPEFQKSVGRILAAEAFGENQDTQFADEAGRVFDFLLETARFDPRDRQAAAHQREYHRRKFVRNVSDEAVNAMRQLLAQGEGAQPEPVALQHRRRTLRQVSRGVDPQIAAERAGRDHDYRKWVLSTNTGFQSANQAEALLRGGLENYREYISQKQILTIA